MKFERFAMIIGKVCYPAFGVLAENVCKVCYSLQIERVREKNNPSKRVSSLFSLIIKNNTNNTNYLTTYSDLEKTNLSKPKQTKYQNLIHSESETDSLQALHPKTVKTSSALHGGFTHE